jgi:hypothetical protein
MAWIDDVVVTDNTAAVGGHSRGGRWTGAIVTDVVVTDRSRGGRTQL